MKFFIGNETVLYKGKVVFPIEGIIETNDNEFIGKLKEYYPVEAEAIEVVQDVDPINEGMTKKDIMALLDEKAVPYNPRDTKPKLLETLSGMKRMVTND